MAWRRPGDKPLSEPMMVSLLTPMCVTRPQWVNTMRPLDSYLLICSQGTSYGESGVTFLGSVSASVPVTVSWPSHISPGTAGTWFLSSYKLTAAGKVAPCWLVAPASDITATMYRQLSNISRTKFQNLNISALVLRLPLPNPLKPCVRSRMKMYLEQRRQTMLQLHLSFQ